MRNHRVLRSSNYSQKQNEQYFIYPLFSDGVKLDESNMSCKMSGCEHDYSSNTYRMMVELWSKTSKLSDHFIIIKIDPATGFPKICGLR